MLDSFSGAIFSSVVLTTVASILLISLLLSNSLRCILRSSPGPWGVPLLGFYPFLRKDFDVHLTEMVKIYGDAYLLSLGGKLYLHLGSHKALREAFITKSDCFPCRNQDFNTGHVLLGEGVVFLDGEAWRVWRKFLVASMRDLGLSGKDKMNDTVTESVQSTINALKKNEHQPINLSELFAVQCTESIRLLILGDRISSDTALKMSQIYMKSDRISRSAGSLLCGNIARYLILPWNKDFKGLLKGRKEMDEILYAILSDHKHNFDPDHPKDFIDLYLLEKQKREQKNDPQAKYFNDKTFIATLTQMYGDGCFTVSDHISDYLKALASRLDVQNAIYDEIVREIGTERLPTYEDRNMLPFTNSVVREIERTAVIFNVNSTLESSCDTTISGVFVPKGTVTLVNLYAIHNDPLVYKNPEKFDPARFMPDEKTKRSKEPLPVLFGVGRRACSGESFVRGQLFVFLTAILQKFTLHCEKTKLLENEKKTEHIAYDRKHVIPIPRTTSVTSEI